MYSLVLISPVVSHRLPWTVDDDRLLRQKVAELGAKKWSNFCPFFPGRKSKSIRERWVEHVNPDIDHSPWREEELERLKRGVRNVIDIKTKRVSWTKLMSVVPGRTAGKIKNYFNNGQGKEFLRAIKGIDSACQQPSLKSKSKKRGGSMSNHSLLSLEEKRSAQVQPVQAQKKRRYSKEELALPSDINNIF